jgi:DNA-binding transcriptional LysR family regulator
LPAINCAPTVPLYDTELLTLTAIDVLTRMRLEDLNYFLAVAEESHVGRAAQRLGVTQPALTKGIQRIENDLGLRLFERSAKGMTLTTAGAAFYRRTRDIRTALDEAIREANDMRMGQAGLLRVGIAPQFSEDLFAPACAALLQQRPGARIEAKTHLNDELFQMLRRGDLDFCVAGLDTVDSTDIEQIPLFSDEMCVGARSDHPLLALPRLRFEDLAAGRWLLPGPDVVTRRRLEAHVAELGLPGLDIVVEWNASIEHRLAIVRHSDLLTIVSRRTLASPAGRGLSAVALTDAVWLRQVGIALRRGAYLSPLAHRMIEILRAHASIFAGEVSHNGAESKRDV